MFEEYGCGDALLDMMKIEYMHKEPLHKNLASTLLQKSLPLFQKREWLCGKEHAYTLPEFAVLLGLYSQSEVQHRLCGKEHAYTLPEFAVLLGLYSQSEVQHRVKCKVVLVVYKSEFLGNPNRVLKTTHGRCVLYLANFSYRTYEPPNVPPYPYPYVPYPYLYTHYPDMGNSSYGGGQYRAPGDAYLFTGAMPGYGEDYKESDEDMDESSC
nr:hypothetical protein [Tanacetum cinerariifolium]